MSYRMFDYLVPNVNFFGPNAISVVGERCQLLGGKKALLVTDKGLRAIKDGAVDKTLHYLREAGIEVAIFDGVEPNPKDTNVRDGLAVFRREQCDIIVTVGGGSPHDCGKGIGIAATHEGDLYQYAGIETLTNPLPPIVAVNTTAGTASEVTRHCVLTNTETKVKFVIVSWRNLPSVSINDPLLMIGKPAALTAATGMDALTHAVEAYISKDANPVTDAAAMQAIRLIARNLPRPWPSAAICRRGKTWPMPLCWPGWLSITPTSATCTPWRTSWAACTTCRTAWPTLSCCRMWRATT